MSAYERTFRFVAGARPGGIPAVAVTLTVRGLPFRLALSFVGAHADGGGQCHDLLHPDAPDCPADVRQLYTLWRRWHLNDMRAGCEHQRGSWRRWRCGQPDCVHVFDAPVVLSPHTPNLSGEATVYCPICARRALHGSPVLPPWAERPINPALPLDTYGSHLPNAPHTKTWNMLAWVSRREHPDGLLSVACPVCGYCFGSGWLYEPIPATVLAELATLFGVPSLLPWRYDHA